MSKLVSEFRVVWEFESYDCFGALLVNLGASVSV